MKARWMWGLAQYAGSLLVLGGLWSLLAQTLGEAVLPSPEATVTLFLDSLTDEAFLHHVSASVWRLFLGLAAASAIAFPLGVMLGHMKRWDAVLSPSVFMTYPIPKIVFLPVFFVLFGLGDMARVVLIALTTGYQILVIVRATGKTLDPVYEKALRHMGGTWIDAIKHVYLPAALPAFLTSLKVASGTAIAVLFMAESFATDTGLGYLIMDAWGIGDSLAMFNGIMGLCVLGVLLYGLLSAAEWALCPWLRR